MFKLNKKRLISYAASVLLLIFFCSLIPALRRPILNTLKYPLNLLTLLGREISGIVFYHRNFVLNARLRNENDLLKKRLSELNEIYLENKRFKNILSFKQKSSYRVIPARVIARSPDNWSSVIIVDKGAYSGIRRGMPAITYLGLAGRVIDVSESNSKIMLVNDPNFNVSAIIQRSRQEGLVSGTLGSSLIMKYLPKDSDIKPQDIIITSGLSGVYPKGLLIGTVVSIGEEFSGLNRYCLIKPAVNLSSIEEVLIIIP